MSQETLLIERTPQVEEIRSIVLDLLNKCGIVYPGNDHVDEAYDEDCHAECIRRGYDMNALAPTLRVGVDLAGTSFAHVKDKTVLRYIGIYGGFVVYLDELCRTEAGTVLVSSFLKRFFNNEPQEYKILDDMASVLKEINVYWRPITASLIFSSFLNFFSSGFLDHETKGMQLGQNAINYPSFSRRLSGIAEAYAVFIFPTDMPTSHYAHAIPDICDFINFINDVLSFYKEELQEEDVNYVSLVGKTRGLDKIGSLRLITDCAASAHERVLSLLEGETYNCYKAFCEGYIGFHAHCRRYKLDQLNL
ncbi:hypothetical protein BDQ17DRAFT_1331784 [Cyathus striatus]|nr:hypothetical protein BDQ17DRAFT_1331784 [Cyathus striatus]